MSKDIKLYHGSQQIIKNPAYGIGKPYNDYGRGFYCTESIELAKEWACPVKKDGYANEYILHTNGLNILYLTKEPYNILSWMAILSKNRRFDINNNIGSNSKDYLLEHYLIDVSDIDVIIGYRADDSYFSFAEDFINNVISLRDLNTAMQLGALGEQVVLVSEKAFEHIEFSGYEVADFREYYFKRVKRDDLARESYRKRKKELAVLKDDIFMIDIIREEMKSDDARIQFYLSK
ncbi:MAG: DUF3990 domain-containing protein [Lachnospiraceae bacterium]|nr:DUF3990 domain-containing protein [Lachnospiraceae bacterium]